MLSAVAGVRAIASRHLGSPAGVLLPISVGFAGSIDRACFSDLLLRACPGLETAYRTGSRKTLLTALRSRRLDIAIYPGAPATDVGVMPLCMEHLAAAVHGGHRFAGQATVPVAHLRDVRRFGKMPRRYRRPPSHRL